jgi:hypothetical protein
MHIYRNAASDEYWIWLVIPTETERDNTYDVVFHFFDADNKHKRDMSIARYDFQVFANTPSFAYTYAYVYRKVGLLIPQLADKLGRRPISDSPDIRNRNQNVMYDKYIYFGARYILESKKMNRVTLEMIAKKYDEKYLISHIRSLERIEDEYRKATEKLKKKKKAVLNHDRDNSGKPKVRIVGDVQSAIQRITPKAKNTNKVGKSAHRIAPATKTRGTIRKR